MPTKKNYLTNEEILVALEKHAAGDNLPLTDCAMKLGEGIYRRMCGQGLVIDLDEVVQNAVGIVLLKAGSYDPTKGSNPFSYLTTIIWNELRQVYRKASSHDALVQRQIHRLMIEDRSRGRRVIEANNRDHRDHRDLI